MTSHENDNYTFLTSTIGGLSLKIMYGTPTSFFGEGILLKSKIHVQKANILYTRPEKKNPSAELKDGAVYRLSKKYSSLLAASPIKIITHSFIHSSIHMIHSSIHSFIHSFTLFIYSQY